LDSASESLTPGRESIHGDARRSYTSFQEVLHSFVTVWNVELDSNEPRWIYHKTMLNVILCADTSRLRAVRPQFFSCEDPNFLLTTMQQYPNVLPSIFDMMKFLKGSGDAYGDVDEIATEQSQQQ